MARPLTPSSIKAFSFRMARFFFRGVVLALLVRGEVSCLEHIADLIGKDTTEGQQNESVFDDLSGNLVALPELNVKLLDSWDYVCR